MIQQDIINGIALGVVGWRQPTRSGSPVIDSTNTPSSSGLYFQDGHSLCTIDNIKSVVDDDSITDANLNTLLNNLSQSALTDVCNTIFTKEDHIDTGLLYKFENRVAQTLAGDVDFVGFQIDLSKRNDLALIINSLILEFNGAGSVKVLLFNSTQQTPIKTQVITTIANTSVITPVDWRLTDLQYGGMWYIGYLRGSLSISALDRNYRQAILPYMFPDVGIRSIRIAGWNQETMFDPLQNQWTYHPWGLNFNMSLFNDFTQIVKTNINRFAKALQLQVCVTVLKMISNSTRSNKSERLSKAYAMLELDGNRNNPNMPYTVGLNTELKNELKRLHDTYNPRGIVRATL